MAAITGKLFWKDQYLREFTASLVKKLVYNNRAAIVLDQTGFYATSGGQPHDTGAINGVNVIDVVENHDTIIHVLEKELEGVKEGDNVKGKINWVRRVDHMQQHHGQHLLSKAFIDVANAGTLSFHLGKDVSYIDLDSREVTEDHQLLAQDMVNFAIYRNLPVQTSFYSLAEAKKLPLRKLDDAVVEPVRIVQVGGKEDLYDMQACCGTHPAATGQVQSLAIVNYERIKKTTRLYFVCGSRVVTLLHNQSKALKRIGLRLTSPPDSDSVERAFDQHMGEVQGLRKTLAENEKIIVKAIVQELEQGKLKPIPQRPEIYVGCTELEGRDLNMIRAVAKQLLANRNDTLLALLAKSDDAADATYSFVIGESTNFDKDANLKPVLAEIFAKFPGKGGGDGRFMMGNLAASDVKAAVGFIEEKLRAFGISAKRKEEKQ